MGDLYCVSRLGYEAGREVIELVEATTGQPCPCKVGQVCPLAPLQRVVAERSAPAVAGAA